MKNTLTIIFILLSFINLKAQTFQGVIKDIETGEPISQITIVSADQTFFVTSNDKGEVVLPEAVLNKKVFINDYEYVYSEKTFTTAQPFVWELTPNSETLEEIVIYEDPVKTLDEIIANSIKSFSNNIKLEAYYRENYFENNQTASFAEGIVDFYINHNLKDVQMVAKESRIKDFSQTDDIVKTTGAKPQEIVEGSMRFKTLREIIKDKKKYEFYVTAKQVGDKTIHTCYFGPTEKSKKRFLLKGYFVFDETKKLILETNYAFDPEKKKHNKPINIVLAKMDILDVDFSAKYIATERLYYPSYAKMTFDLIANSKVAKLNNVRVNNQAYFYVLKTEKTTQNPAESDVYNAGNLYSRGTIYKTEFWKDPQIINLAE